MINVMTVKYNNNTALQGTDIPKLCHHTLAGLFSMRLDMKQIPLANGMIALVSNSDYKNLRKYHWNGIKGKSTFYATRSDRFGKNILMHRQILGLKKGDGVIVDHKDLNGINNTRRNIRKCTNQQNHFNGTSRKNSTSKYKGVGWDTEKKKWVSQIMYNHKRIFLGYYKEERCAAMAYDKKAKKLFGEFSRLNLPEEK
jgi:hypothetical protein